MTARIIDGKAAAAAVRADVAAKVASLGWKPGLAVILVGDDPASAVYVRSKDKAATETGITVLTLRLPADTAASVLLEHIAALNADPAVDGILLQLPLPDHLDANEMIAAIDPAKDVDGFHPLNVGLLASGRPALVPCTPLGVMRLLEAASVPIAGARAVVMGRSAIVGRPMLALLLAADATVTAVHSRTRDLAEECRRADILIAAVGQPEMVKGSWLHPGTTVIDVGIHRKPTGGLVGDVDFASAAAVAGAITPVPGGVGPMTIACLLENTLTAAVRRRGVI